MIKNIIRQLEERFCQKLSSENWPILSQHDTF